MLQRCVDVGYKESEALLLIARIHLANTNIQLCLQTLESALSNNFEVLCVCARACVCVYLSVLCQFVGATKCSIPSRKGPSRTTAAASWQK